MAKLFIIDVGTDRMGSNMNRLLDDGAFPERLSGIIKGMMQDIYPVEIEDSDRRMWPGMGFPVRDPMHAILNHLYASAQRDSIPSEIASGIKREAANVMECAGGFDDDLKNMILTGSVKTYNRVLPDGTEIKVEVKLPETGQKSSSKDNPPSIEERAVEIDKRKQASINTEIERFAIDADRFCKIAFIGSVMNRPEAERIITEVVARSKKNGTVKLCYATNKDLFDAAIPVIAKVAGVSEEKLLELTEADKGTDNKIMIYNYVFDRNKFKKPPFDSYANAVKACGKQVADIICDKMTGNVMVDSIKRLDDYAEKDPLMGRVLDRVAPILKWEGND